MKGANIESRHAREERRTASGAGTRVGRVAGCLLALLISVALAETPLHVITLKNRPALELVPVLEPLLGDDEAISGSGSELFLKASPATRRAVLAAVRRLDRAPRMLEVRVLTERDSVASAGHLSTSVRGDESGAATRIKGYSTRRGREESGDFRVNVLEGHETFIERVVSIPVIRPTILTGRGNVPVIIANGAGGSHETAPYEELYSGFLARPMVNGDNVTIEISPYQTRPDQRHGGSHETTQISTTVSGKLGAWIELGSTMETSQRTGNGTLARTRGRDQGRVWIRVDLSASDTPRPRPRGISTTR